ncbi:MAG: heavy-metal-associated domain-containing protein [Bacteroidia bacterium]|nr:heavy-metal-associated domain-containing protein [Bacteroidia bacterium]
MNNKILIALIALFVSFGSAGMAQRKTEVKIKVNAECDKCKTGIEKLVKGIKGVKKAEVDLSTKTLTVVFLTKKTSVDVIRETIAGGGWEADDVKPKNKLNKDGNKPVNPHTPEEK